MDKTNKRNQYLGVRVTEKDIEALDRLAEKNYNSRAGYVLKIIREHIKENNK